MSRPQARTIVRTGLQEFTQHGCGPELQGRLRVPKYRSERVRETPDGPRPESFVSRLVVKVMNNPGKVFGSFESALDERLVDDHLRRDVRQFISLPGFHLL
jgi:hypothetical protein